MRWMRRLWWWGLDYVYAGWQQVRGVVRRTPGEEWARGDAAPVLLLPGVYETWGFLRPVAEIAAELGHPVHVVTALGRNRGPVADMAAVARCYVDDYDLVGVVVVAHSKGGLIGKRMMLDDADGRIDRMIAVNTPFGGSRYARYVLGRTLREFSPRAETVRSLAAEVDVNARIVSIFAEFDPHIPEGSHLEGATNVRLPIAGHFRVLASRELRDAVRDALAEPAVD